MHPAKRILELRHLRLAQAGRDRIGALEALRVDSIVREQACEIVGNDQRARLLLEELLVLADGLVVVALQLEQPGQRKPQRKALRLLVQSDLDDLESLGVVALPDVKIG